jgi:hypothetical protein
VGPPLVSEHTEPGQHGDDVSQRWTCPTLVQGDAAAASPDAIVKMRGAAQATAAASLMKRRRSRTRTSESSLVSS